MEYFVSPDGADSNPGTSTEAPFHTIGRGVQGATQGGTLQPGDILTLRGGTYVEEVSITNLAGKPGQEISIRSYSGERAVIDSSIPKFRTANNSAWVPASTIDSSAHPDEWVSDGPPFPAKVLPERGAFLDTPYRRLVSYSYERDFRADNQTFGMLDVEPADLSRKPYKVTDDNGVPLHRSKDGPEFTYPWVYMGPGIWRSPENRVHIRLTHTTNNVPGLEDYTGPTDPNQLGLAICDLNRATLSITASRCLVFQDLTFRFGGSDTIHIEDCHCLVFDGVEVWASEIGVRFGAAEVVLSERGPLPAARSFTLRPPIKKSPSAFFAMPPEGARDGIIP